MNALVTFDGKLAIVEAAGGDSYVGKSEGTGKFVSAGEVPIEQESDEIKIRVQTSRKTAGTAVFTLKRVKPGEYTGSGLLNEQGSRFFGVAKMTLIQ